MLYVSPIRNPGISTVNSVLTISNNLSNDYSITVYNTTGELVLKDIYISSNNSQITGLETLEAGIYILTVKDKSTQYNIRVVKQ